MQLASSESYFPSSNALSGTVGPNLKQPVWLHPRRGLPISTSDQKTAETVHQFEEEVLSYGSGAAIIFEGIEADPDCALAQAYGALAHLFRTTREGNAKSVFFAEQARRGRMASEREQMLVSAICCWSDGDALTAIEALYKLSKKFPEDLFSVKLLQHLLFARGRVADMRQVIENVLPANCNDARAYGMHAFALDQAGEQGKAEVTAKRALEMGHDPWAHHALAHVMDAQQRYEEGRRWMHANSSDWGECTSFLFTHNWWHAALFHIALGDYDGALELYDTKVWAKRRDYCQDQLNAISLLARLELAGVPTEAERWSEIAKEIRPRRFDAIDGFLDLHYIYAFARAGEDEALNDLSEALSSKTHSSGEKDTVVEQWRNVMPGAARGVAFFARGECELAERELTRVEPHLNMLGGSTVQRDLFAQMLAAAVKRQQPAAVTSHV